ncbi:5'-methylthioadenosine/adenosylhomocysteine nucleosidase [Merdimmobilis hominis]|jgi:adenosylhomocysteine nucleosidase|uniref:adenosylhomocysteine nucleosidase n=1 Tax=uncultured Anaerotruncus sp. TaxID=905011 RepID=A0A6N2R088_9FIRM|nr:5'-methylthioadenosine/adenosylhomocysteine nucleosidase [Merdimmobilis hominis]MCD4836777.1 5'-methylthioadenosine/adenosylhomocysteine nucleosidase [Merdimmobilis hominis]PWL64794.1 MAG: 5'-methylthioadenosine/adenosylhomocysteine nucleosidase [Oscillospiraceae bacterium]
MVWGILGALDEEVALIQQNMEIESATKIYGTTVYTGKVYGQQVVLVCCGIGKVNAAACASVVLREFGADAIINVGIAGAAAPQMNILDVVLSDEVVFHDTCKAMEEYYPFTQTFRADETLLRLAEEACQAVLEEPFHFHVGRIATGDQFVESKAVKDDIVSRTHPLCVEMEGAAVGQIAVMNNKPFLVIRSMSDNAEDNANDLYDNFIELAAGHSAAIILEMLKKSK